jgi:hypothetical protein
MRTYLLALCLVPLAACATEPTPTDGIELSSPDGKADGTSNVFVSVKHQITGMQASDADPPGCYPQNALYTARYFNKTLPWGTSVELHSGRAYYWLNSQSSESGPPIEESADWDDTQDTTANAVEPYTWEATRSIALTPHYVALELVWKITLPDGNVIWDNGGLSPTGYYKTQNAALIGDDQAYTPGDYCGAPLPWDTDGWPLDALSFER